MKFDVGQRVRVIDNTPKGGKCPVPLGTIGIVKVDSFHTLSTILVDYPEYNKKNIVQFLWRFAPATPDDPYVDTDF